ncbi:hypothetical protein ACIQCR_24690 [Streptomyces sp. NPDC093249]|uniref:hypothetical protein n=1 Tax=unclassified Streptomyces TaxID=2593676 RepID=UPI0037F866A5
MRRSHIAPAVAAVVAAQALTRLGHRITTQEASTLGAATVEALTAEGWTITAGSVGTTRLSTVAPELWKHDLPILAGLARGRTYREIAAETDTPEGTTRHRAARLISRTGASNAAELIALAYRAGWMNGLPPERRPRIALTEDEQRALVCLADGMDTTAVGIALDIPHGAAVRLLRHLYAALDATRPGAPDRSSRCRAVALAYQHGLLPLPTRRTPQERTS